MAGFRSTWAADKAANRGYPKSLVVLWWFRAAQAARAHRVTRLVLYPFVGSFYKFLSEWMLGIELPASTEVAPGLRLRHGVGLVVNPATRIGAGVMLRQGVTLGNRREAKDCPVIGDGVEIGAGATVIGSIVVGVGARIGAGAVVISDVPAGGVAHVAPTVIRGPGDA